MKHKNQNYKFNKKSPKSKISEMKKEKQKNDYSKIICEVFGKNKEESKNNNLSQLNNNVKITSFNNNINKAQIPNKYSKNIIKIELNYNKKIKNNLKEESSISLIKEKKFYYNNINCSNSQKNKKIFQSNSEKNMVKDIISDDSIKKNIWSINKTNNSNSNVTSLNKNIKINVDLNPINDNHIFRKQKTNKSTEKKIGEKIKHLEDVKEKSISVQYNINEVFGHKKGNEQIKQFYQNKNNNHESKNYNNSKNKHKIINKKMYKSKNINLKLNNNSPDKIIIKINNAGHNIVKNKYLQKKIYKNNTGMISNYVDSKKLKPIKNKKKYRIHNNTDNSPSSHNEKSSKMNSHKKYKINVKNNNNSSSKNSSNSKISYSNNQIPNIKGVKIESINIDLNLLNKKSNNVHNSQKKVINYTSLNDKNSLTLREAVIPKFSTKFNNKNIRMELDLNGNNESNDLNHSFKTAFSLNKKTRSLSRKRDEKKKMNWFKLNDINDEDENEKKLNDILIHISNQKEIKYEYRKNGQKSEPKKLIDKIRKAKKMKKMCF